jgi:hypothetical protein
MKFCAGTINGDENNLNKEEFRLQKRLKKEGQDRNPAHF